MNTYIQCINEMHHQYKIVDTFNVSDYKYNLLQLQQELLEIHKDKFNPNERIVFKINEDIYNDKEYGLLLKSIQRIINTIDISNFFIIIATSNNNAQYEYNIIFNKFNIDEIPFTIIQYDDEYHHVNDDIIEYNPYNIIDKIVTSNELSLLNNDSFCILPWIQLQTDNKKNVYPCCYSNRKLPVSKYSNDISIMGNSENLKSLRQNMINDVKNNECNACYITEKTKKTSYRMFYNHRFAHHLHKVLETSKDGTINVELIAWNLQFDNLCNLKCRTCSTNASSSWISDAKLLKYRINEIEYPENIIDQHMQCIDRVEQIYFGGGEPIISRDHWVVLDKLIEHNRTDVELVYNTNFTQLQFKDKSVFEYWDKFSSVHIGASLDAMGIRAEYWRSGTKWEVIEQNRLYMLKYYPKISFVVMPTVSIVNALHLPDFHKNWVERGLIAASQFDIKLLFNPSVFSILQAPKNLKYKIREKYQKHIEWLETLDYNGKSTNGYYSIINATYSKDIFDHKRFWKKINEVDNIRNERLLDVFPELDCLK